MKQLLVAKDVNYAASKSSATTETATNPDLLADGAIGIYGIDENAGNSNAGKLVLITLSTDAAGKVQDSAFDGKWIVVAQGTADGSIVSNPINVADLVSVNGKGYAAAVRQVVHIGYNGTSGSLNLEAFVSGDYGTVGGVDVTLSTQQFPKQNFTTGPIYSDSTTYDVLASVIVKNLRNADRIFNMGIVSNGTQTNLTNTAAVTNGSKVVTSTAHALTLGALVRISGQLYKVVEVTSTSVFVIDRPYHGATNAALAVANIGGLASITEYGFVLTATKDGLYFEASIEGIFRRATVTNTTPAFPGTGSDKQTIALEKNRIAYSGYHDKLDTRVKTPPIYAQLGTNYNLFFLRAFNRIKNRAEMGVMNSAEIEVAVAFVTAGANSNMTSFQAILTTLYPNTTYVA